METELLQQLGLSKSQVKVYFTLLEIGSSTTGPILHKAGVSSSKVYGILARLIENGLVSIVKKGKTKYYQATSPTALRGYILEKESQLKVQKQKLENLLPQILARQHVFKNKPEAQLFLGWKGIMTAFEYVLEKLKEGDDYIGFAQTEPEEASREVKKFFTQYHRKREGRRLRVKLIAGEKSMNVFLKKPYRSFKNFQVRFLNHSPPGIVVFKDHILMTTLEQEPIAVIISSPQMAHAYKSYFEELWKLARPVTNKNIVSSRNFG